MKIEFSFRLNKTDLITEKIIYNFNILNEDGDLDEKTLFHYRNYSGKNLIYLPHQSTSFKYPPSNELNIRYLSLDGNQITLTSKINRIERTWLCNNENRKSWLFRWDAEFERPIKKKGETSFYRCYSVKGTEKDAFCDLANVGYITENPTKKVIFNLIAPAYYAIKDVKLFVVDESGDPQKKMEHFLKQPVYLNDNHLQWKLFYPLQRVRYGFYYRFEASCSENSHQ